ncbi:MAG: 3-deoxy-8-phosphooctulonate synthase, partial [Deltaproteobacteria bacterium]
MRNPVNIGRVAIGEKGPFFLIAGPCVVESEDITLAIAGFLRETEEVTGIPVIFKASYDKANRTSV